jgi:hypothetical protein
MVIVFSSALDSPINASDGYNSTLNVTSEVDTNAPTGIFIIDVLKILGMAVIGIGLPASTPVWVTLPFALWSWFIGVLFIVGLIS